MNRPPIRSIAVFGGGIVALSAAIAFSRALRNVSVKLVQTPLDTAALADRLPGTLPTIGHPADFGIDEAALVNRGAATHRLGQRFTNWGANPMWLSGFGATGVPIASTAFHQHWLFGRSRGVESAFHRFSPAAAMAEANKFVHPVDDARSPLSQFSYALRLDPNHAAAIMLTLAQQSGIVCQKGMIAAVDRSPDGHVQAVRIDQGSSVSADLFIDCTGPIRSLIGMGQAFEDWSESIPCDRLLLATQAIAAPSPTDRYDAIDIGWRATWPLRTSVITGLAYSAALSSDAEACDILGIRGAECIAFCPGRCSEPWQGNVLALGDASVVFDPFGWTGLPLAHAGISLALELLPGRNFHPLELAEYNRRTALRHLRARDFLELHYRGGKSPTGRFWQAVRDRMPRASLNRSLGQFSRRGTLPHHEEETFDKESWIAAMIGLGVYPQQRDPAALSADPKAAADAMREIERAIGGLLPRLPPYAHYLAGMAAS